MFTDQISDKPRYSNKFIPVSKPSLARPTPLTAMPEDHTEGWGLSFSISHHPSSTGRSAGAASWEGLANLYWFADRKNKLGGIIATQIAPYGGKHEQYPTFWSCHHQNAALTRVIVTRSSCS